MKKTPFKILTKNQFHDLCSMFGVEANYSGKYLTFYLHGITIKEDNQSWHKASNRAQQIADGGTIVISPKVKIINTFQVV